MTISVAYTLLSRLDLSCLLSYFNSAPLVWLIVSFMSTVVHRSPPFALIRCIYRLPQALVASHLKCIRLSMISVSISVSADVKMYLERILRELQDEKNRLPGSLVLHRTGVEPVPLAHTNGHWKASMIPFHHRCRVRSALRSHVWSME